MDLRSSDHINQNAIIKQSEICVAPTYLKVKKLDEQNRNKDPIEIRIIIESRTKLLVSEIAPPTPTDPPLHNMG